MHTFLGVHRVHSLLLSFLFTRRIVRPLPVVLPVVDLVDRTIVWKVVNPVDILNVSTRYNVPT